MDRPLVEVRDDVEMEGAEVCGLIEAGHCPDCRQRGFVIGPQGGSSINIECANVDCRARFNVGFWSGQVIACHRIERQAEGGNAWPSEPSATRSTERKN